MIEDAEAVEHINEIVETEGLDLLFVGTNDLTASLGLPGQPLHPKVVEASEKVLAAAARKGIALGYPVRSVEDGTEAIKRGFRVFVCGNAEGVLLNAIQQYLGALRDKAA